MERLEVELHAFIDEWRTVTIIGVGQILSSTALNGLLAIAVLPAISAAGAKSSPQALDDALVDGIGDQHDKSYPIFHDVLSHQRGDLSDWTIASDFASPAKGSSPGSV